MKSVQSYNEWLNESKEGATDELDKLPLLVKDFIDNVIRTPGPPYFVYTDWWCVPDVKMCNDAVNGDPAEKSAAEKFESQQRRLPFPEKLLSDYFLVEFMIQDSRSHFYNIVGIDTAAKDLIYSFNYQYHQEIEKYHQGIKKAIEDAFDKSLQKNFPTHHTSRKFGL
jgi:hypothetical protein